MESEKPKEIMQEEWNYDKEVSLYTLENKYISKYPMTWIKTEGSLDKEAEDKTLQTLDPSAKLSEWKGEAVGNEGTATDCRYSENVRDQLETLQALYTPDNACFPRMLMQDGPCACGTVVGHSHNSDPGDHEGGTNSLLPTQDGEATAGEYATNLAESVLQDAFIRLSQSQPTLPQESAVSVSVGSALLPSGCSTKDIVVSPSWNDLPKIVIVQSPDGSNVAPEPGISSCSEMEVSLETSGVPSGESDSRHPQSALEVALACAATMIGTISSPQATERLKMEQQSLIANHPLGCNEPLQTQASQALKDTSISEYSFPSALCGMTQVASAVAVCGLGEMGEVECPEASSRILSAAESSAAIPPLFTLATGRGMELGKEAIAEALFKEAALVLTGPDTHSGIGDLMASMNRRIMEVASKPQSSCPENVLGNELAQALSNVILKHSIDEVHQQNKITRPNNGGHSSETLDTLMESANQLLFNVICSTFKKMSHIAQHSECPTVLSKETSGWREPELGTQTPDQAASQVWTKAIERYSSHALIHPCSTSPVINDLADDMPPQQAHDSAKPGLFQNPMLQPEWTCSARAPRSPMAKLSPKDTYLKGTMGKDTKHPHQTPSHSINERRASSEGERTPTVTKYHSSSQDSEDSFSPNIQEKYNCASPLNGEVQVNLSLLGNDLPLSAQSMLHTKHTDMYCITDFAEELAETIVSMATEIAAICLDNSNGKQPWFCAWKRGAEFLVTPNVSCRSVKRKKESQAAGASVRKHKPPRLSEIKRKTDEHPELKEKLMNRVVDESMNLEDVPDSVNVFANEVAAKIVNLTEFSLVDGVWQAQSLPRNRLHSGDRWMRRKASSCESIAEEDSNARAYVSSLGLMSTLSQPGSRASSVSKQSSCESITDEFSRFMVNQMENEGRGFELLLDYYAGKNASSIVNSAVQQACRRSDHLSVRPSCPSKQSSTESITEEFYRYMLRDAERESKDSSFSRRSSQDWTAGFLSPSLRSPLCYRQSSMPDGRALGPRLTVNAPLKANSLDGFAQNSQRDFLSVQPGSSASSTGLCKSDSCLYRRGGTDQITTMLIQETWANSIEALMRKNKIIADDGQANAEPVSAGSPLQGDKCANRLASSRVQSGPVLLAQDSVDYQRKDSVTESLHPPGSSPSKAAHLSLDSEKETSLCHGGVPISHPRQLLLSREVPLIQIEVDQREECVGEPEHVPSEGSPLETAEEHLQEDKTPDVGRGGDAEKSASQNHR